MVSQARQRQARQRQVIRQRQVLPRATRAMSMLVGPGRLPRARLPQILKPQFPVQLRLQRLSTRTRPSPRTASTSVWVGTRPPATTLSTTAVLIILQAPASFSISTFRAMAETRHRRPTGATLSRPAPSTSKTSILPACHPTRGMNLMKALAQHPASSLVQAGRWTYRVRFP